MRFKRDLTVARLSDERIGRGRKFQFLVEDTQKAQEAKEDLAQGGTARRQLVDSKHLNGLYWSIRSAQWYG